MVTHRARSFALAASLLLSSCGLMSPKLDFSDPTVIVYTTRLGFTQTTDTVAALATHGQITKAQATGYRTQLNQGVAALDLAETAIAAGHDATDELDLAVKTLTAVRNDPALKPLLVGKE